MQHAPSNKCDVTVDQTGLLEYVWCAIYNGNFWCNMFNGICLMEHV